MASPMSLLTLLRSRTAVDCDTLDVDVAKALGPFQDCTSNQAIAFHELQGGQHETLLHESIQLARRVADRFNDVSITGLAVEISMIRLSLRMVPFVSGFVHVQVNPLHSYSTTKVVANAQRLIEICRLVDVDFDTSRICIKVPSTWEGLQACRILQQNGITTLATTLFTLAQATLAAEVGCHYIAPYLNELRVQVDKGYKGDAPNFGLCVSAQRYYRQHNFATQVIPASLTSIDEIRLLAGVDHITVAPAFLRQLADIEVKDLPANIPSLFDEDKTSPPRVLPLMSFVDDEESFRMFMTRDKQGLNEAKLTQAINIFCDVQLKMDAMMKERGAM